MVSEEATATAAMRAGDETAFGELAERYRRQLRVHIYRMLGSFDEAEDLVQETLLRAWRARSRFEGRSLFRTWLYRIATNLCLNTLERAPRRIMPSDVTPPVAFDGSMEPRSEPPWAPELPWLQPIPDHLLEPLAPPQDQPDTVVVSRETIELAYLAAIQHLPPRQRAVLILRDALDWSAAETAELLETSVVSVNSALQRARSTMRGLRSTTSDDRPPEITRPSDEESSVVQRFMEAWDTADTSLLIKLLRDDARLAMPPAPLWFDGRAAIARLFERFPISFQGEFRSVRTGANRQPAVAAYLRKHGESTYRLSALQVLRIEGGSIVEITTFSPALVQGFDLPAELTD
jgi:RNA polymerase sigma-70 factor (ECF subfamily)